MGFYQRLKDLKEDNDLTQRYVADLIEVSVNHYGKYEMGETDIPFSKAIKLAEYYNVSLDYIAGRTNDKKFCRDLSPARLVKLFGNLNHDNQIRIEERIMEMLESQDKHSDI